MIHQSFYLHYIKPISRRRRQDMTPQNDFYRNSQANILGTCLLYFLDLRTNLKIGVTYRSKMQGDLEVLHAP